VRNEAFRLGVPPLVDLGRQPTEDALCLGPVGRRLTQVELAAGQRVQAGVDDDLKRATTLTDRTALTTAGSRSSVA
jgi:hypothetical protein